MRLISVWCAILLALTSVQAWAQSPPPPPTGPGQAIPLPPPTVESNKWAVAHLCPVKGIWSLHLVKVGMGNDWNIKQATGDGRYCVWPADYQLCQKYNPTPDVPCKLVKPFVGRGSACALQPQVWIEKSGGVGLGAWQYSDRETKIIVTPYLCDRAYKMESCHYWHANTANTIFSNKGVTSIDRRITIQMTTCQLDEAANALYLQKRKQGAIDLTALLKLKKAFWLSRCAAVSPACHAAVDNLYQKAELEAWETLEFPHDGDGLAVMKAISAKYDPKAPRPPPQ